MPIRGSLKTIWLTWLDKLQFGGTSGLSSRGLVALFYTMIACMYDVNVDAFGGSSSQVPYSTPRHVYPLVHRWLKHVQFVLMLNQLFPIWKTNNNIAKFFDGDVFERIWLLLGEEVDTSYLNKVLSTKQDTLSVLTSLCPTLEIRV